MKRHRGIPLALAGLLALHGVRAGEEVIQQEEMVVSARGRETPVSRTPGGIGVVDTRDLLMTQPLSLTNTTRRIPGVEKTSDGAWGSEINIRGLDRNRVVYLIDGVRINTATDLGAQFGLIDPNDIERVEVLKGPISALYGSGAIGGVANVVTRRADFTDSPEWRGGLSLSCGTNPRGIGTHAFSSYSDERLWFYASGTFRDRDSYRNADRDRIPNSQFEDWSGRLRLGWKWDEANITEASYLRYEGREIGVPGRGMSLLPNDNRHLTFPRTGMHLLSLSHTILPDPASWTESRLQLSFGKIERRARIDNLPVGPPPAYPVLIETAADHRTFGANWQNTMEFGDHTLVWGIDWWLWKYDGSRKRHIYRVPFNDIMVLDDMPLADSSQSSTGIFAEDEWRLSDTLTLNLGGRLDRIVAQTEDNPSDPSGRAVEASYRDISWAAHAGLAWEFRPQWTGTLLAASSYRTPDMMDRFKYITLGGGGTLYGNPDLDPERSLFFEAGLHYQGERLRGSAAAFLNQVEDLVAAMPEGGGPDERMQNVSRAEFQGFELEGAWFFSPQWAAYATLAYVEGRDKTGSEYLRFVPPMNGLLGLRYEQGDTGFWGALELDWAARQNHTPKGVSDNGGWATLNARLGYRFEVWSTRQEFVLAAENLANADYTNYLSTSRGVELREPGFGLAATWRVEF